MSLLFYNSGMKKIAVVVLSLFLLFFSVNAAASCSESVTQESAFLLDMQSDKAPTQCDMEDDKKMYSFICKAQPLSNEGVSETKKVYIEQLRYFLFEPPKYLFS